MKEMNLELKTRIKKVIVGIAGLGVVGGIVRRGILNSMKNTTDQNKLKNTTLTPVDMQSIILSNVQYVSNATTQTTGNTKVTEGNTILTTSEVLITTQTIDSISKNKYLNQNHTHASMRKAAVYIPTAIVVLLITTGIILKIYKVKLKNVFTDINQYDTNSPLQISTLSSSYPNTSLNQRDYLINQMYNSLQ